MAKRTKQPKLKPRYFVDKPGANGGRRYYWQPSADLQALGWKPVRLCAADGTPFARLEERGLAIAAADARNAELDSWRSGKPAIQLAAAGSAGDGRALAIGDNGGPALAVPKRSPVIQIGSLAHLIRAYKASDDFKSLREKTRDSYEVNMRALEAWGGDAPIRAIGPARVQALYHAFKERTPSKARALVGMLRILLAFAIRTELLPAGSVNAASDPRMEGAEQTGRLWPLAAIGRFIETADAMGHHSIGTAVLVNHWLGQRQADVLKMKRVAYRDGRFFVAQRKSGGKAKVAVPHSPWVQARVDAELQRQAARGVIGATDLLLCETTGQTWDKNGFHRAFAAIRAKVAATWPAFAPAHDAIVDQDAVPMAELQFMHLRHTAVTELAIAGCTVPEIAAITGHTIASVEAILERYLVRTSELAAAATTKRLANSADIAALFPAPAKESK